MKKKVLFVLPSLSAGGAERVMSFVAQHLNTEIFDPKLVIIGFEKDTVYNIDKVEVQYLNKTRLLTSMVTLFNVVLKEKPTVVISSIGHVNIMMGLFSFIFRKIKFIGREASVVSKMNEFSKMNINDKLVIFFYTRLATIICQSDDMKQDFIDMFGMDSSKLTVIHNPITCTESIIKNHRIGDKIFFVTVGRLSEEKGYLRIIEGLSKIKKYDFQYTIIGAGSQETIIKETISKFNLTEKVLFISYTSKVSEEIAKNDFFIQGSYVEGFPNALLESCTVGTPVIAFKAPGGTKDIVVNGVNGFLVDDASDFESLLNDIDKLRSINPQEVVLSVTDKFHSGKIIKQYEELIRK